MNRYVCVHGHFYQPPRENPWLEAIEVQDSAYPYHDWNERIAHESYGPNAAARILDGEGRILDIVNNYARISFNFGPTLLTWLEEFEPSIYASVLAADRESIEHFNGHGSAIAQVYNHMIMPLASRQDKETQIVWGIADFEHRFRRKPEGMWLAETAVDLETLTLLAKHGIAYTILAPHQASAIRELGQDDWTDVSGGRIDPRVPYRVHVATDNREQASIDIFFYDGPVSQAVAFEGILNQGERLANRLVGTFTDDPARPQLVHIATDGETYGHHHRNGEMALAYALRYIEQENLAQLTNYGAFLELHPPTHEVVIVDDTSWSCVHGVERWRADCGCNTGGNPNWNQEWRAPLRDALDWLRVQLDEIYETEGNRLLNDPWSARDAYISVVLDRTAPSIREFLSANGRSVHSETDRRRALRLLEMQRHAMLMYTSCGWFFDELSGIETVQVIQYAARAVQLADELNGGGIEAGFAARLASSPSNLSSIKNGATIYDRSVRPAVVDLPEVAAHYAMSSLFSELPLDAVYAFDATPISTRHEVTGRSRLSVGSVCLRSRMTLDQGEFAYAVFHLGDHNLDGGVRPLKDDDDLDKMAADVFAAFDRADYPQTIRLIDRHFGERSYSLGSLFKDEQRKLTNVILDSTLSEAESVYRLLYEDNAPLVRYLDSASIPLPTGLRTAAEFIMNADITRALGREKIDYEYIDGYFAETRTWGLELDVPGISFAMEEALEDRAERLTSDIAGPAEFDDMTALINLIERLPFGCNYWSAQNRYFALLRSRYAERKKAARAGERQAGAWVESFQQLGYALSVHVGD